MTLRKVSYSRVEKIGFWIFTRWKFFTSKTQFFTLSDSRYKHAKEQIESDGAAAIVESGGRVLWWRRTECSGLRTTCPARMSCCSCGTGSGSRTRSLTGCARFVYATKRSPKGGASPSPTRCGLSCGVATRDDARDAGPRTTCSSTI